MQPLCMRFLVLPGAVVFYRKSKNVTTDRRQVLPTCLSITDDVNSQPSSNDNNNNNKVYHPATWK